MMNWLTLILLWFLVGATVHRFATAECDDWRDRADWVLTLVLWPFAMIVALGNRWEKW